MPPESAEHMKQTVAPSVLEKWRDRSSVRLQCAGLNLGTGIAQGHQTHLASLRLPCFDAFTALLGLGLKLRLLLCTPGLGSIFLLLLLSLRSKDGLGSQNEVPNPHPGQITQQQTLSSVVRRHLKEHSPCAPISLPPGPPLSHYRSRHLLVSASRRRPPDPISPDFHAHEGGLGHGPVCPT